MHNFRNDYNLNYMYAKEALLSEEQYRYYDCDFMMSDNINFQKFIQLIIRIIW